MASEKVVSEATLPLSGIVLTDRQRFSFKSENAIQ